MTHVQGQIDSKVAVNIARGKVGQMKETFQKRDIRRFLFSNNPL